MVGIATADVRCRLGSPSDDRPTATLNGVLVQVCVRTCIGAALAVAAAAG